MDLNKLRETLTTAIESETPETARDARKLTKQLAGELEELTEWLSTVGDLIGDVESAAGELDDAGSDDREGTHAEWVSSVDNLRDEIVTSS